jgi:hypothetical protein
MIDVILFSDRHCTPLILVKLGGGGKIVMLAEL